MEGLLGINSFLLIVLSTYLFTIKWPLLKNILWLAFLLRTFTALVHFYIFPLPDGAADALRFEISTWEISQLPFINYLNSFGGDSNAFFFTWILSFLYRIFGRSSLLLQSVSVFAGVLSVIFSYKLSFLIANDKLKAKQTSLIVALFPTVILYSAIILREVYVMMFLLLALIYFVKWFKFYHFSDGFMSLLFFIPLYFLHGVHILGAFVIFITILITTTLGFIDRFKNRIIRIPHFFLITTTFITFVVLYTIIINFNIPYLGKLPDALTIARILYQNKVTNFGGSVYPNWLSPDSTSALFLLIIPRLIYFLFSPFLWDIKAINHLLGFVDALLVLILFYFIIKGLVVKKQNKTVTILCIILLPLLITYSWGVGNFGTALRHRSKFIPVFIAISTIYVPKITLTKKSEVPKPNE